MQDSFREGEDAADDLGQAIEGARWLSCFRVSRGCRSRTDVMPEIALDFPPVSHHPEVDIRLRMLGKSICQSLLTRNLDDWLVNVGIPIGDGLAVTDRLVPNCRQPIAMTLDVLPDFIVAAQG